MPATLDTPACTAPPPRGADGHFPVPTPDVLCPDCDGLEPDPDFEAPCCLCRGKGVVPAQFRLRETRSHAYRAVYFHPGAERLRIATADKAHTKSSVAWYSVAELGCDGPGRLFLCAKDVPAGAEPRNHRVYLGPDVVSCTCEGETYQTSAKHNQRAHETGGEIFPTYGCVHCDALEALLRGGWFDL